MWEVTEDPPRYTSVTYIPSDGKRKLLVFTEAGIEHWPIIGWALEPAGDERDHIATPVCEQMLLGEIYCIEVEIETPIRSWGGSETATAISKIYRFEEDRDFIHLVDAFDYAQTLIEKRKAREEQKERSRK
jgi:hypothetical protein